MYAIQKKMVFLVLVACIFGAPLSGFGNEAFWTNAEDGEKVNSMVLEQGDRVTLQLFAELGMGENLRAYSFTVCYPEEKLYPAAVSGVQDALFPPLMINSAEPGKIYFNGMNTDGVRGPALLPLIEVDFTACGVGPAQLALEVKSYGDGTATFDLAPQTPVIRLIHSSSPIKGDVNLDMRVDLADTIHSLKATAGNAGAAFHEGDANGDRRIGPEEAVYTLRVISGLSFITGDLDRDGDIDFEDLFSALQISAGMPASAYLQAAVTPPLGQKDAIYILQCIGEIR